MFEELISEVPFEAVVEGVEEVFEGFKIKAEIKLCTRFLFLINYILSLISLLQLVQCIQNMKNLLALTEISIDFLREKHIIAVWFLKKLFWNLS